MELTPRQVQEIALDYTHCSTDEKSPNVTIDSGAKLDTMPVGLVSSTFKSSDANGVNAKWAHGRQSYTWPSGAKRDTNVCLLEFTVPADIKPPIYFYYRLTNFYQNHRRYVKSFDQQQLKGDFRSSDDIKKGECDPLDVAPDGRPYYPCGLIANSMFNDSYSNLTALNGQNNINFYNFTDHGISWSSEGDLFGKTKYKPTDVVPPPNWAEQYPEDGYDSTSLPDLHTWEAFQVWMRTAGLPTFSKLAYRNDHDVLKSGTYRLQIYDRMYSGGYSPFPITNRIMQDFQPTSTVGKSPFSSLLVLSSVARTRSWVLPMWSWVVSAYSLALSLPSHISLSQGKFLILCCEKQSKLIIFGRKLGDHTYLSWNNDQPSTATTTGRARPGEGA